MRNSHDRFQFFFRRFAISTLFLPFLLSGCGLFMQRLPKLPKQVGFEAYPGPQLLVDIHYLIEKQSQEGVTIIDVRNREEFEKGHVGGAICIPARIWRTPWPNFHLFHIDADPEKPYDIARYEEFLGARGVSHSDEIILYGNPQEQPDATVPIMILDWLGHENAHFVDGNAMEQWVAANQPVDLRDEIPSSTRYRANPRPEALWPMERLLNVVDRKDSDVVIWDCRRPEMYSGAERLKEIEHAGHIPGAINIYYQELYRDEQAHTTRFYSEMKIFLANRGITPNKQIVVYDNTGSHASYVYCVLRMMDFPRVGVYEAGWSEWGNHELLPYIKEYKDETTVVPRPLR